MSGNTCVKCTNCNVVISEVLAFIRNKHDVMDNESLIRICASAFSEEEIDEAKKLLFVSTKTNQKLVSRRKNKKQKDLEDVISVFKTIDPDHLPVFVAYDLHKLPPISFDHVDVTKLLKDLLVLRAEVVQIKDSYVTKDQLEKAKLGFEQEKTGISFENSNVNISKRGGYVTNKVPADQPNCESSLPAADVSAPAAEFTGDVVGETPIRHSLALTRVIADECDRHVSVSNRFSVLEKDSVTTLPLPDKRLSMAEIVNKGDWKDNKRDEEWILVQKAKSRNRFTSRTGRAVSDSTGKFKAAETKIPLFISNVNKETTEGDICDYIQSKCNEPVKLEKINMKSERPYNAFKLFVPKQKLHYFLDDNVWPEGITFRRFIKFTERGRDNTLIMKENTPQT